MVRINDNLKNGTNLTTVTNFAKYKVGTFFFIKKKQNIFSVPYIWVDFKEVYMNTKVQLILKVTRLEIL